MAQAHNNKSEAARLLGLARGQLYSRLKRHPDGPARGAWHWRRPRGAEGPGPPPPPGENARGLLGGGRPRGVTAAVATGAVAQSARCASTSRETVDDVTSHD